MQRGTVVAVFLTVTLGMLSSPAWAADWPMWRHDAGRSAASPEDLPDELHLLWEREYSPRSMAWDEPLNQDRMPFDKVFEPVAAGGILFVGFNDSDKMVALDAATGKERWTFYTDGPVRLPAVAANGKVYFASDDGCLYCVSAKDGKPVWTHRGAPADRRLLGNGRLVSTWPSRGGPVLADGVLYYAAGIWPFMGVFIYALDAETGREIWVNDSTGAQYLLQPHETLAFAGVAPQGALAIDGDNLLVPGGRSVPACFERATGKFTHFLFGKNNKTGGSFVCAEGGLFLSHHKDNVASMYETATGKKIAEAMGAYPVLTGPVWCFSGPKVTAYDAAGLHADPKQWSKGKKWEIEVDATGDLIAAGGRLYAGAKSRIAAVTLPADGGAPAVAWTKGVEGDVQRLLAADGTLFAVTLDGRILAFGAKEGKAASHEAPPATVDPPKEHTEKALGALDKTGIRDGYALVYGGDGALLEALALQSNLRVVGVQPDEAGVAEARKLIDAKGLYGERVEVHRGDLSDFNAPPYFASLTVADGASIVKDGALERLYRSMRPYDGKAYVSGLGDAERATLREAVTQFPGLKAEDVDGAVILTREGPLQGAGTWTHLLGDVAQTGKSDDQLVKLPLGLLWFGGNSHVDVLPRHGHGPSEQVVGGRLFIEGLNCISARDVYTGRVLWKKTLQGLGNDEVYFNGDAGMDPSYNQGHIPGANVRGTNFVATADMLYIVLGGTCLALDAATGEGRNAFAMPPKDPNAKKPQSPDWGYIGVSGDVLIGGADFVEFTDLLDAGKEEAASWEVFDKAADRKLVAIDRKSGERLWEKDAAHGFLHNGIVANADTVFCLDKLPPTIEDQLARRGKTVPTGYRLLALDLRTGAPRWEKAENVFGSFLCYSEEEDILLQSTRPSRDSGEGGVGKRLIAYRGKDGAVLWDREIAYPTFPVIHGRQIVTEAGAFDLLSGAPLNRTEPLTQERQPWTWQRQYGCNYPVASENLITFRSGAAGYFDFANDGGTGNFGGFKSGCSANLIAADGVLNAPDYTRTCTCSYQNQTSLAMVYMPEAEMWTYNTGKTGKGRIGRVGVNLGAPGDRRAEDGTLWVEYPSVGGVSPEVTIAIQPEQPAWFCHHSARYEGDGLKWVAASGAEGLTSIALTLASGSTRACPYTVRLYFAEPGEAKAGARVFDVTLQGQPVLSKFDVVAESGAPRRTVVKEFTGIGVQDTLTVGLVKSEPNAALEPVLCGIEVRSTGW